MRMFLRQLGLFGLLLALLTGAALARYYRQYPPSRNYYLAALDKQRLMETQTGPRLILQGGSSMAFGVDSRQTAEALGYHPVNLAVHVGLGMDFMTAQIVSSLRPGDAVVLSFEYHAYVSQATANPEIMARLLEWAPELWPRFSPAQIKAVLDTGYLSHLGRVSRAVLANPSRLLEFSDAIYRREHFNAVGDFVGHLGRAPRPLQPAPPFRFARNDHYARAVRSLAALQKRCEDIGADVFLVFPPYAAGVFERDATEIKALASALPTDLSVPMLGSPEDMVWADEYFFDTSYHLNEQGRDERSRRLVALLREAGL